MDKIIIVFLGQQHSKLLIIHDTIAKDMRTQPLHVLFEFRRKQHLALPRKAW